MKSEISFNGSVRFAPQILNRFHNGAAIFLVIFLVVGCGCNQNPGAGEKIGQVVKINQEGVFQKTWEAQLIRGGLGANGSGSFGVQPFDFTIENDATAAELKNALEKQMEIIITYRIEFCYSVFRSASSGHFMTSWHVVTNTPSSK